MMLGLKESVWDKKGDLKTKNLPEMETLTVNIKNRNSYGHEILTRYYWANAPPSGTIALALCGMVALLPCHMPFFPLFKNFL